MSSSAAMPVLVSGLEIPRASAPEFPEKRQKRVTKEGSVCV